MQIIIRHLTNEFLKKLLLVLVGCVSIFLVIDFFERIDNFMEAKADLRTTFTYFLYQVPIVVQQLLPAAILLGTIITLSLMARNRELIILKTSGVSLLRITYPLIFLSFCFTILLFFLNETVLPPLHENINRIWQGKVLKKPINTYFQNEKIWYRGKRIIYHISYYDQSRTIMYNITIYQFSPTFELTERIDADRAQWDGNNWVFADGIVQTREKDGSFKTQRFKERKFDLVEQPQDFINMVRNPEELTLTGLKSYVAKLKREGYASHRYTVDLQSKIAFPFVCVIMTLVGIPLSLRSEKKWGIALGVGFGVTVAFLFWVFYSMGITAGHTGLLPPLLAGWMVEGTFLVIGLYLLITTHQ